MDVSPTSAIAEKRLPAQTSAALGLMLAVASLLWPSDASFAVAVAAVLCVLVALQMLPEDGWLLPEGDQ